MRAIPYASALMWMLRNDDTSFLDEDTDASSVTAAFCADIYRKTDEEVRADLLRLRDKLAKEKP